jgi:hypothetical protein
MVLVLGQQARLETDLGFANTQVLYGSGSESRWNLTGRLSETGSLMLHYNFAVEIQEVGITR